MQRDNDWKCKFSFLHGIIRVISEPWFSLYCANYKAEQQHDIMNVQTVLVFTFRHWATLCSFSLFRTGRENILLGIPNTVWKFIVRKAIDTRMKMKTLQTSCQTKPKTGHSSDMKNSPLSRLCLILRYKLLKFQLITVKYVNLHSWVGSHWISVIFSNSFLDPTWTSKTWECIHDWYRRLSTWYIRWQQCNYDNEKQLSERGPS